MFELVPAGSLLFVVGRAFLALVGGRLLPARRPADAIDGDVDMTEYLTDVKVEPDNPGVGEPVEEAPFLDACRGRPIRMWRDGEPVGELPDRRIELARRTYERSSARMPVAIT